MNRLMEATSNWLDDRKTMKEHNFHDACVIRLFCEEVGEFCDATSGKSVQEMKESLDVREELGDLILYLCTIFHLFGLDPTEIGMEKVACNMIRYPAASYQSGDFEEVHGKNRSAAKEFGIKQAFYAA